MAKSSGGSKSTNKKPKRVFILGGGAAFGAHQAGALDHLISRGIVPDAIIGSSVGILNALLYASGGKDLTLKAWRELNSLQVLVGPSLTQNILLGNSLMSMDRLVSWVERTVDFERVFASPLELKFVVLNLSDGQTYLRGNRTERDAADFRTISHIGYRIPILYPPVLFEGDYWCDGGFAWNLPLEHAIQMGAKEIYVLSVIRSTLPEWKSFSTVAHVAYRMMEVLWAGAGNASRLRALVKNGQYHGARIVDIEPSEYFGADPVSILWTHGPKAERLIDLGRLDASRALDGLAAKDG
jgi:predicted acylesterase/phospholipase RssA